MATKAQVIAALESIKDPHTGIDIIKSGFVKELKVSRGRVTMVMRPPEDERYCPQYVPLAVEAKRKVLALNGISHVEATFTGHLQERAVNEALKKMDEHT